MALETTTTSRPLKKSLAAGSRRDSLQWGLGWRLICGVRTRRRARCSAAIRPRVCFVHIATVNHGDPDLNSPTAHYQTVTKDFGYRIFEPNGRREGEPGLGRCSRWGVELKRPQLKSVSRAEIRQRTWL